MISVVVLIVLSGITAQAQDTPTTAVPYLSLNDSFYYYNDCSWNASVFNADCVKSNCSGLTEMCTPAATGCSSVSSALSACAQQPNINICGVPIAHKPICLFKTNLFGISAGTAINALTGDCVLTAGTGWIDNLDKTTYCVTGSGPYTVTIDAPQIYGYGDFVCTFAFFGQSLVAPTLNLKLYIDVQATATVDLTTATPTVTTNVTQSSIALDDFNFNNLPFIFQQIFNVTLNYMFETFGTTQAAANMLATYAASGLQANQQSCKQ